MGQTKKPAPTKSDIIVIAKKCIDEYDSNVVRRLDTQDNTLAAQNKVMMDHTVQLTTIQTQLREIYGNGSGRKGILDNMKEVQATQAGVLATVQTTLTNETQANELFRVEVRNALKIRDVEAHVRSSANSTWIKWFWRLLAPLGIAGWEVIKVKFHIGEK